MPRLKKLPLHTYHYRHEKRTKHPHKARNYNDAFEIVDSGTVQATSIIAAVKQVIALCELRNPTWYIAHRSKTEQKTMKLKAAIYGHGMTHDFIPAEPYITDVWSLKCTKSKNTD